MTQIGKYRERLASVQHDIWSHWMRYLFSVCNLGEGGEVVIPAGLVERWKRQMNTPYSELTETEKDSDRLEADKTMAIVAEKFLD